MISADAICANCAHFVGPNADEKVFCPHTDEWLHPESLCSEFEPKE